MRLRARTRTALAISLCGLLQVSIASISFPDLQPITGFPQLCATAYGTVVESCEVNDFPQFGGTGSCSVKCETALNAAEIFIQRACSGLQAPADSLIGQLFIGDVVVFLCDQPSGGSATTAGSASTTLTMATDTVTATASATQATLSTGTSSSNTASASSGSASNTALSTGSQTSSSASSTSTTKTGSNTNTNKSSSTSKTNSSSATTSTSLSDSTTTKTSKTPTTTSSTHTATSTHGSSNGGSGGGDDSGSGGGSPFDGSFTSAGQLSTAVGAYLLLLPSVLVLTMTLT